MCRALSARNLATSSRALAAQSPEHSVRRAGSMNHSQTWLRDSGSGPGSQPNTRSNDLFQAR